jgi:hypothetical protein
MAYDPKNPASIFEGDNLEQFAAGLTNAYALKRGLGGEPCREDVGVCMVALTDGEQSLAAEQLLPVPAGLSYARKHAKMLCESITACRTPEMMERLVEAALATAYVDGRSAGREVREP